jgi:Winged helix DNA-binding domain
MTEQELYDLRRAKWHLDGKPIRTIEEARAFVGDVGFCLMYPVRPAVPVPTFIGAVVGSDTRLPTWQHAYSDRRAIAATEFMVRLLRERSAYEASIFEENNPFLVGASAFPFFYALIGERNPKLAPKQGPRSTYSPLAADAFEVIARDGSLSKQKLQETLGKSISIPALDKALGELLAKLRITRVDYNAKEGSFWDVLYRWSPDAVKEGVNLSMQQALSALLSKYLDCVIAADQTELESFFGKFVARSRVKEAVNALLAARELSFIHVSGRSMLHITPEKEAAAPKVILPPRSFPRPRPSSRPSGPSNARPSGRPSGPPHSRPSGRPSGPNSGRPRTFSRPRPKSGGPR